MLPNETILQEADRLINGDRQKAYGNAFDDFSTTARLWEVVLGLKANSISPEQVALCMVQLKVSRELRNPKRDNRVDMAGYTGCLEKVIQERG